MQFVTQEISSTLEVKQSKFIAHLFPFDAYDLTLKKLQEQHPKARHFVIAYRYLNEYDQIVEYASDDGEPKSTAGKPSLMVLQGEDLINTAVIIVRYFGGTKLGTGGLVRAYSDAVNLVIQHATLMPYKKEFDEIFSVEYSDIRFIEYTAKELHLKIIEKKFENAVVYKVRGTQEQLKSFFTKVERLITRN